jgi:hypothetical protein
MAKVALRKSKSAIPITNQCGNQHQLEEVRGGGHRL